MPIIHRYLVAPFLRNLGYTMVGALVLFTVLDLVDHMGSFVDNDATVSMIARYYLFKAAWIVDTVLPVAMLMATLFTIGTMARYLELTALFTAGWSLLRVTQPLIVLAIFTTVFSLLWREFVLPQANVGRQRVWDVEIHGNPDRIRPTQHIALTGPDGRRYSARRFDPNTGLLTGLRILAQDGAVVTERIDAERAEWDGEHWILHHGTRRVFAGDDEVIEPFEMLTAADLAITPRGLYRTRVRQENMNIRQLLDHRDLLRMTGGDPASIDVDIQFQLAFPMVNFIVVCLGVVLASGPRKTTIASGFGLTLLVGFGYYLLMMFGRSLGHTGVLPPIVAGWAGNVVYAILAWVLFARARR